MHSGVDNYLKEGCGRCDLVGTPQCKVRFWPEELIALRAIVLDCGLTEELKWQQPCYTLNGKNVLIVTAFKEYACISFFKGSLLKDPEKILVEPGKNSQAARQIRFTDVKDIHKQSKILKKYIQNAIAVEEAGLDVEYKKTSDYEVPEELQVKFAEDPVFKAAFEGLTPGRQRGYLLHFSGAKQSATRINRIEKSIPRILDGLGIHDR